jgi:hypothetical protein
MTNRNKKFLLWFVGFGKIKARILYFLFLFIIYSLLFVVFDLAISGAEHTSLNFELKKNIPFYFIFFAAAPFISWRFYDIALKRLREYKKLENKGLTPGDLKRIAFVKRWERIRISGIWRYCFFDGGLIIGMLLLFPVSFAMLFILSKPERLFAELSGMFSFIGKNIIISYAIGLILYRFKWTYNERRFLRLTNPTG